MTVSPRGHNMIIVITLFYVCADSPVLLSFPHFYMGDPRLREAVNGMDAPDPDRHEFYIDVQPVSAMTSP